MDRGDAGGGFRVSVRKEDIVFAAAHFITLPGHRCESLHGHNYRAGVEIEGGLEPDAWYVYDFVALKQLLRRLTGALDHKVLLPNANPTLQLRHEADAIVVSHNGTPRYRFPASDCVVLPIPNTTVEMLAQFLAGQIRAALKEGGAAHLSRLEVEVEETFGQAATYREGLVWD